MVLILLMIFVSGDNYDDGGGECDDYDDDCDGECCRQCAGLAPHSLLR